MNRYVVTYGTRWELIEARSAADASIEAFKRVTTRAGFKKCADGRIVPQPRLDAKLVSTPDDFHARPATEADEKLYAKISRPRGRRGPAPNVESPTLGGGIDWAGV